MTAEEATQVLEESGYRIVTHRALPHGRQLQLARGQIVNVYDTGRFVVQGRDPTPVKRLLEGATGDILAKAMDAAKGVVLLRVNVPEVRRVLSICGYYPREERRLDDNDGTQLFLRGGAVITVFDRGAWQVQGTNHAVIEAVLTRANENRRIRRRT